MKKKLDMDVKSEIDVISIRRISIGNSNGISTIPNEFRQLDSDEIGPGVEIVFT